MRRELSRVVITVMILLKKRGPEISKIVKVAKEKNLDIKKCKSFTLLELSSKEQTAGKGCRSIGM